MKQYFLIYKHTYINEIPQLKLTLWVGFSLGANTIKMSDPDTSDVTKVLSLIFFSLTHRRFLFMSVYLTVFNCFHCRMDDQDRVSQASSVATISYFPVIKVCFKLAFSVLPLCAQLIVTLSMRTNVLFPPLVNRNVMENCKHLGKDVRLPRETLTALWSSEDGSTKK